MDDLQALSELGHRALYLAGDLSHGIHLSSPSTGRPNSGGLLVFQHNAGTTNVVAYRHRHHYLDVAEYRAVECGFRPARRAAARHPGKQLDVASVAFSLLLGNSVVQ